MKTIGQTKNSIHAKFAVCYESKFKGRFPLDVFFAQQSCNIKRRIYLIFYKLSTNMKLRYHLKGESERTKIRSFKRKQSKRKH